MLRNPLLGKICVTALVTETIPKTHSDLHLDGHRSEALVLICISFVESVSWMKHCTWWEVCLRASSAPHDEVWWRSLISK